ncbi:MAG: tetratricopeptide repeat protein [Kiritimatiellae bacterium]|nr:tetratricopeptide repeat protein [Kiritimatiellia bacterium]
MTIPEELLPVIEWWEKDGKQTLAIVAAAAVVVLGYQGVKNWREAKRIAGADALMTAESVEELESAVASYGNGPSGAALKMRLAKAYYDAGSYESAAELYGELSGKAHAAFADIPELGLAECLEAQGKTSEAVEAYNAFVEARPESPYALQAKIGAARATALGGDKAKALEMLGALKKSVEADDAAVALVETAEDIVKRWEKREFIAPVAQVEEAVKAVEEVAAEAPAPEAAPAPAPEAAPAAPASEAAPQPEA